MDGGEVRRKVPGYGNTKVWPRPKISLKCRFMATAWCCSCELKTKSNGAMQSMSLDPTFAVSMKTRLVSLPPNSLRYL